MSTRYHSSFFHTPAERDLWNSLGNIHSRSNCRGRACPVHNPSNHHMRAWFPYWRRDRAILERICAHGIGHPDPDQYEFWADTDQDGQAVHGCDGCCTTPKEKP